MTNMENILSRLFAKKGIKDTTELSPEELHDFQNWQRVLSEEAITVQTIADFCKGELLRIESQFKELEDSPEKKARLALLHSVYASIRDVIEKPKHEREALVKYLENLISTA